MQNKKKIQKVRKRTFERWIEEIEECSDYESEEDWSADEDSGVESDSW